jgi:hypothetical protein
VGNCAQPHHPLLRERGNSPQEEQDNAGLIDILLLAAVVVGQERQRYEYVPYTTEAANKASSHLGFTLVGVPLQIHICKGVAVSL